MSEQKSPVKSATIMGAGAGLLATYIIEQGWFGPDANIPVNQFVTALLQFVQAAGGLAFVYGARRAKGDIGKLTTK